MRKCSGFVLVAAVLMSLSYSIAQEEKKDTGQPIRFRVGAEIEGTDNRDSNDAKESNFDIYIKPRVDAVLESERSYLDCYYEPAYRHRTDPAASQNDDEFQHDLGINATHLVNEFSQIYLRENYRFTDDPSVESGGTTLRRDSSYSLNNLAAGIKLSMDEKTYFEIGGKHFIKRYDDDAAARESDEDMVGGLLSVNRRLDDKINVKAELTVTQFDYDHAGGINRGFNSFNAGVGVQRKFTDVLQGGVQAGITSLNHDDSSIDSEVRPFVQALLSTDVSAETKVTASAKYVLRNADVYPYSSQESTDLFARVDWKKSDPLRISAWGTYRLGQYDSFTSSTVGAVPGGDETTIGLGVAGTYFINETTSIRLAQTLEDVDSDVDTSFSRNATRLSLYKSF